MSTPDKLPLTRAALLLATVAWLPVAISSQETAGLGTPITEAQLAAFDLIAQPDGSGLPPGSGTASAGKAVYQARCAACHGLRGEGISSLTVIAGGDMHSAAPPLRTVGSYWPYASTLFDYVRRAMPADAPKSLDHQQVYQVVAYVLHLNGIVTEDQVLDARTLPGIKMPNASGFIDRSHIH